MTSSRLLTLALPCLGGFACGLTALDPIELLEADLTLGESIVAPGEAFSATLVVSNPTARDLEVVTGMGCLAEITVERGGEPQFWKGARLLCTAAVTRHLVAAGESIGVEFDLEAKGRQFQGSMADWTDVDPGVYVLGTTTFPAATARIEVRR